MATTAQSPVVSKPDATVRKTYLNQRLSGAFSGLSSFMKNRKNWKLNRKQTEKELRRINSFAVHRDARKHFKRRPMFVDSINSIWQADLKELGSLAEYNNCNSFVLVVIDSFSKVAYTRMIKQKTAKYMIPAFKSIFREAKIRPQFLLTDR